VSRAIVSGEFIAGAKGPIFVLLRRPAGIAKGCVLVVPPFAEEMNKCRRMVTEVALGLVDQGSAALLPDLYGTGDSGGNFGEGDWATWLADLAAAVRWSSRMRCPVTGVLAIRLGAALAATAATEGAIPSVPNTVLWQPVFDGKRFLTQFLRLRIAASLMEDRKESLDDLRGRLEAGAVLEVAGYDLSARLAADLIAVTPPKRLAVTLGEIAWLEVIRDSGVPLSPPSINLIEQIRAQGRNVHAAGFPGAPFWSSTEIVVNKPLILATVSRFSGGGQGRGS
jgi:exosortase A-associated hydrolase 2